MKLILTREVPKLGAAGDVVTVKDGFARNFLLPRGNDIDHAKEIKSALEEATLSIKVKVGTGGRLFGSVTDKDVAAAIKSATGNDIDRHSIKITGHIKKIGKHTAKVSLAHGVVASVNITVVSA
jgi:large subunit ribosomal protein L9